MTTAEQLELIASLAKSAGEIARRHYGHVERLTKTHAAADAEAVSIADRAVQAAIVSTLREKFPGDGIIGEEDETGAGITFDCNNPLGRNWVIDPIDGTNNFLAGLGAFAVCIGLLDAGRPVLGVVYDVTRDEMYAGAEGVGATLNGRSMEAAQTPMSPASMLMMTSNLLNPDGSAPAWAGRWIGQTTWKVRVLGSAAIEAVLVARGVAHGAVTVNGKLWDCVAPAAIVLAAGGAVSSLRGESLFPFDVRNYRGAKVPYLSAGRNAHQQLVKELAMYE